MFSVSANTIDADDTTFILDQPDGAGRVVVDLLRFYQDVHAWHLGQAIRAWERVAKDHGFGFIEQDAEILSMGMLPGEQAYWEKTRSPSAFAMQASLTPKLRGSQAQRAGAKLLREGRFERAMAGFRSALLSNGFGLVKGECADIPGKAEYGLALSMLKIHIWLRAMDLRRSGEMLEALIHAANQTGYGLTRWSGTSFISSIVLQIWEEAIVRAELHSDAAPDRTERAVRRAMRDGQAAMSLMACMQALERQGYGLSPVQAK